MSGFDGSGNYVRPYNWTNDATNAIPITASRFDTDGNTVASAFGICLTRDNQGKPSAPLIWTQPLTVTTINVTGATVPAYGMYQVGGDTLAFSSNTTLRLSVNSTGNWTMAAPSSGTPITISTVAATNAKSIALDVASATSENLIQISLNAVSKASLGVVGTAGNLITGSVQNDFGIRLETANFLLSTNGGTSAAVKVASAGNVTIAAPSSGTSLAITSVASGVFVSGSDGTRTAQLDFTGAVVNVRTSNHTFNIVNNSVTNFSISTARQATVYEPLNSINAAKNAATYEIGTFTGTLTGCTTSPTATVNWSRAGNVVTLEMPALSATSNATTCTVTGLPSALQPNRTQTVPLLGIIDNSAQPIWGILQMNASSGTMTLFVGVVSGTRLQSNIFTNSGTKGIAVNCTVSYNLT